MKNHPTTAKSSNYNITDKSRLLLTEGDGLGADEIVLRPQSR